MKPDHGATRASLPVRRVALRWLGLGWVAWRWGAAPALAVDAHWPAKRIRLLVA